MNEVVSELFLTCEKHPSQVITHICCLDTCLSALCVKCMKSHNLYHKQENVFPELETVEDVREFCCEKLLFLIENYNKELEKIKSVNSPDKPDPNLEKLAFFREKMISFINNYFNELEREYEKRVQFLMNDSYTFSSLIDYFRKMITSLEDYLQEIKYKCTLETLQHILVAEYQQDFDNMKAKNHELCEHFNSQRTSLVFEENRIQGILQEVEKIAGFQSNLMEFEGKIDGGNRKNDLETMRNALPNMIEHSLMTNSKPKSASSKCKFLFFNQCV